MAHQHHHAGHSHGPDLASDNFNVAFALAVILNLGFTVLEAVYAVMANSMSLLADAGHNLGDVLGLLLAWGASLLLAKAASKRFSYGFKRTTIIAALVNALILIGTSAIIAYESILKLIHPGHVHELTVIIIALIGIFINGGTALMFMRGRKNDLNIKGAFLHLAYDALISLGVVITGTVILFTNWYWLDPVVGLMIVAIIIAGTWRLLIDSVNLMLDAVPSGINHDEVKNFLAGLDGVVAVHDLHIWGLSTKEAALTVHLVMPDRSFEDIDFHHINNDLKTKFDINHVTIQIERGTENDPCGQAQKCV